jgi:translation initiation factor 2B subunit (eIF-2B alpha/beta/delta family)
VTYVSSLPKPLLEAIEDVKRERIRGAAWCALRVTEGLLDSIALGQDLCKSSDQIYNLIISANPSMASLYWVARTFKEGCEKGSITEPLRRLLFEISEVRKKIPEKALELFGEKVKVMTLSYSSNVEAVLRTAYAHGVLGEVLALESRPGGEGIVFANNLKKLGAKVKVIPDASMHFYLKEVDYVMVGADTITRDACLVHKIGTRLLAEKAYEHNRPLIVVFEPFKINLDKRCGEVQIVFREYEIENWGKEIYPLFDETPAKYISLGVTSEGVDRWSSEWLRRVAEKFKNRVLS